MCTVCTDIAHVEETVRRSMDWESDEPDKITTVQCDACSALMILDEGCCRPIAPEAMGTNGSRMLFIPAKLVTRAAVAGTEDAEIWTCRDTFNLNDFCFGNDNKDCGTFLYEDGNVKVQCHDGPVLQLGSLDD
jgi:hypothetical protein